MAPTPPPWLLIIFRPELTLAWLSGDIGAGFTSAGELFEQVRDDDLSGFYDRLYSDDGMLAGIQISPMLLPDLASDLASLPYIRSVNDGKQLQILFDHIASNSQLHAEIDQSFGGRTYKSYGNDVAMSLDTFFLDETERQYLASRPLKWVNVRPIAV
jgi:hypothetical protein